MTSTTVSSDNGRPDVIRPSPTGGAFYADAFLPRTFYWLRSGAREASLLFERAILWRFICMGGVTSKRE